MTSTTADLEPAVDLFAGAGGWDVAAQVLGIDPLGIENDAAACATRDAAGLRTIQADIRTVDPIPATGLIGSPPCQTFSSAGKGSGRKNLDLVLWIARRMALGDDWRELTADLADERTALVLEPLHWILTMVEAGTPYRWVALEQVPQVLPVWECYAEIMRSLGYSVATGKLTSEMYGVPQTRKRAILVASLDHEAALPPPTHSRYHSRDPSKLDEGVLPWISMAEALGWGATGRPGMTVTGGETATGGAEPFGNGARAGLAQEREAGHWQMRSNYGTGGDPNNRGIRDETEPAPTVTSKVDRNKWSLRQSAMANATVRHEDQPAPTITAAHDRAERVWLVSNTSEKAGVRPDDAPAPTMYFGARLNKAVWEMRSAGRTSPETAGAVPRDSGLPSTTLTGKGTAVWMTGRPATTVQGDPRVWPPGHKVNGADRERLGADEADGRYGDQAGSDAVRVTVIEAAVLQSFPPDYPWQGTLTKQYQQVGNAIPPLLALHVLAAVTGVEISDIATDTVESAMIVSPTNLVVSTGNYHMKTSRRLEDAVHFERTIDVPAPTVDTKAPNTWRIHPPGQRVVDRRAGTVVGSAVYDHPTRQENESMKVRIDKTLEITDDQRKAIARLNGGGDAAGPAGRNEIKAFFEAHGVKNGLALLEAPVERAPAETTDEPAAVDLVPAVVETEPTLFSAQIAQRVLDPLALPVTAVQAGSAVNAPILMGGGGSDGGGERGASGSSRQPWSESAATATEPSPRPEGVSPHREIIDAFEAAIAYHPRTQQRLIGPSEIGTSCDRCLAHKLVGSQQNRGGAWLPTIGTAVHAWADPALRRFLPRMLTELRVYIGIIGNRLIGGTADIFDPVEGRIVDLKVVGANTLKHAKAGPTAMYRKQVQGYGRGCELAGHEVNEVAILYLPRNSPSLADSIWWSQPYDRQVTIDTLSYVDAMWQMLQGQAPADLIPTLAREPGCYDCPRYPLFPGEAPLGDLPKTGQPFAGILPPAGTVPVGVEHAPYGPGGNPFPGILA